MGNLQTGHIFTEPSVNNHAADLNNAVNLATIQGVGSLPGEMAAGTIALNKTFGGVIGTAASNTPAMRALGTGANDAAAGTTAGNATALQFGANTPIPLQAANPSNGQIIAFSGGQIVGVSQSSAAPIGGTGTVSTAVASPAVTGTGTKFLTELAVNYLITVGSVTWRVISIASNTSLQVNANWGVLNTTQAFTYIISAARRPWNSITSKSTTFAGAASDAGVLFACDTSGGSYAGTLPAASSFAPGDTASFMTTTDDANVLTVTCAGGDAFVDGSTTFPLTTIGGLITCESDGVSQWKIVSSERTSGTVIQRVMASDSTQQDITTHIATPSTTPTTSNTTKIAPLSLSITPKSAFSKIRVRGLITGDGSNSGQITVFALFTSTTLLGSFVQGKPQSVSVCGTPIDFEMTSGTTSALPIDLYIGCTNSTYHYLGTNTGASLFGGSVTNILVIEEIAI